MTDSLRTMMREPLLHFLLGGVGLFLLFSIVSDSEQFADDEIIVSAGQLENIVSIFRKTRQRDPSSEEFRGLIDNFIIEEVLYREAVLIGLDNDDTIIRRRLRQKMEFLLDDFTVVEPSDDDLQQFLDRDPERFRTESIMSFEQIYLNEYSPERVESLLTKLRNGEIANPADLSESYLLPYQVDDASESIIGARFGEDFKLALFDLEVGHWQGPVESPFGVHLVRIERIVVGHVPDLSEIRKEVGREWLVEFRATAQQEIIERMKAKYTVRIEAYESVER